MEAEEPISKVSLNAHELNIRSCDMEIADQFSPVSFQLEPTRQELLLTLPKECSGQIKIKIEYKGQINDTLVGLYRSKYVKDDQEKYLAVTQFEETHAR